MHHAHFTISAGYLNTAFPCFYQWLQNYLHRVMEELLNVARFLFLAELLADHLANREVCDKDAGML